MATNQPATAGHTTHQPPPDAWWTAALFVAGCELLGFASARLAGLQRPQPWIDETPKPAIWPPAWVFPAVFSLVNFPSLGIASWLVWRRRHVAPIGIAGRLLAAQLAYNAAFLPVVYAVKRRWCYVAMDVAGVGLTVATLRACRCVSRPAAVALLPFAVWLCFTTLVKALWWRMEGPAPSCRSAAPTPAARPGR